jgi:hypothetical protein
VSITLGVKALVLILAIGFAFILLAIGGGLIWGMLRLTRQATEARVDARELRGDLKDLIVETRRLLRQMPGRRVVRGLMPDIAEPASTTEPETPSQRAPRAAMDRP